jgi:molecular chaperone HscB
MKNYFEMLDLPKSPSLDEVLIRNQYFAKQRQFHPDNAKNSKQRLEFLQISADINAAYHTLKSPENRLYYLLKLQGVDILSEHNMQSPSPAILMEAMELREEMLEANSDEAKQQFAQKLQAMRDELLNKAITAFENNDLQQATNHAMRLRYLSKI